jgi:hypothetical protein
MTSAWSSKTIKKDANKYLSVVLCFVLAAIPSQILGYQTPPGAPTADAGPPQNPRPWMRASYMR